MGRVVTLSLVRFDVLKFNSSVRQQTIFECQRLCQLHASRYKTLVNFFEAVAHWLAPLYMPTTTGDRAVLDLARYNRPAPCRWLRRRDRHGLASSAPDVARAVATMNNAHDVFTISFALSSSM